MKPLLFLWITFLFSFNIIPTAVRASCADAFSCGNISGVKFPFSGGRRDEYCGRPELKLTCQDNIPKFTIDSVTYRILNFDSSAQNLTVARDDYSNTICPSKYENTTFDPTVFEYGRGLVNVTLLYGCSSSESGVSSQSCESGGDTVYYVDKLVYEDVCRSHVIIPIFKAFAGSVMSNQMSLQEALDYGFSLQWVIDSEKCNDCIRNKGDCGYENGGNFTCSKTTTVTTAVRSSPSPSDGNISEKGNNGTDGAPIPSPSDGNITKNVSRPASSPVIESGDARDHLAGSSHFWWNFQSAKFDLAFFVPFLSFIATVILIGNIIRRKAKATKNDQHIVEFIRNHETLARKKYSYSDVKKMTNKFAEKLGQGGYGSVYRGKLLDGRHVAVKLLKESSENGEEFMNEVASIIKTSHINIVSLLGFCYDGAKRALIYEFMSNGSLDKFIYNHDTSNVKKSLEWKTLHEIAVGIAQGLEYLHQGCNMRILHLDIKPHNILLDDKFCPKISDFGLAKLCNRDKSAISMLGARGTVGYIAPEVYSRNFGRVSYKSDVYSYGMMVFEMVGARNDTDFGVSHTSSEVYFPNHIYKSLEEGHTLKVDGVTNEEEEKIFKKLVLVSLWCIQTNPIDRPSMTKVLEMFEGSIESLPFPPLPFLSSPPRTPPKSDESSSTAG